MCVVERYFIVYPNGHREPKEQLRFCPRGTPNYPCNHTEVIDLPEDIYAPLPEAPPAPRPQYQVIEPRAVRRQPQQDTVKHRSTTSDGLKLIWGIRIPFTSGKRKSTPQETGLTVVRRARHSRREPIPPVIHQPPPPMGPPLMGPLPMRGPPPPGHGGFRPIPRPAPLEIELLQEQELRRRAERVAQAEREARVRAQHDAHKVEKDAKKMRKQRNREKMRNNDLERENRHLEQDRRDREASAERERRRKAADRAHAERARAESRERARFRLSEAVRHREEEEERAWLETIRRDEEEEAARFREERARLERRRQQGIPREPRHPAQIHQHGRVSFEERGARVIENAIRAEDRRQAEADAVWLRPINGAGGRRRGDQVAMRRGGGRFFW